MTFREAIERMSTRKVAALGGVESAIVGDAIVRLLCAGTAVDYDDVNDAAKLMAANAVHMMVMEGVPLVATLEGMFIDALMTGHLVGSADA